MAPLNRQQTAETTKSAFSSLVEKGLIQEREYAPKHDTIAEEDEGGNVGQAEFLKSQNVAEIVRPHLFLCCSMADQPRFPNTDASSEQGNPASHRLLPPSPVSSPVRAQRCCRALKLRVLTPLHNSFLLTQTLQYLDKTALNYGKVFGLEKSMNLQGQQFSWVASTFYFGYLVAQMPVSYLIGCVMTAHQSRVCLWSGRKSS